MQKSKKQFLKYKHLLSELNQSRQSDVITAINKMLRVRIGYDDKKGGGGKRERSIMPVAFGIDKHGRKVISAYQTAGSTKRGVPKWKLFFYDNIFSWSNSAKNFKDKSEQLKELGLNTKGDKRMMKLFAITPIADSDVPIDTSVMPIDSEPISKADISPKWQKKDVKDNSSDEYVSAQKSREGAIDITKNQSYFKNKVEAPKAKPITKKDVNGQANDAQEKDTSFNQDQGQEDQTKKMYGTSSPIKKSDIEGQDTAASAQTIANNVDNLDSMEGSEKDEKSEKGIRDNELTKTFNDLTNRMNNLYKDEDED